MVEIPLMVRLFWKIDSDFLSRLPNVAMNLCISSQLGISQSMTNRKRSQLQNQEKKKKRKACISLAK